MIKKTSKATTAPKKSAPQSLADLWDSTDASEASNNLPTGTHTVRLNEITMKVDPKKGEAAIVVFEAIDGDYEGKTARQFYKLKDIEGNKGPGIAYLQRDLALLGYENIPGAKIKKTLKEISDDQPMCVVNVKENGQYTNVYLQGLAEEGIVDSDDTEAEEEEEETEEEESEDSEEETEETEEESEEEEEEEPYTASVGDDVKWTDEDGDEHTGTIKKLVAKAGKAKIEDEDGDEMLVKLEDLEPNE